MTRIEGLSGEIYLRLYAGNSQKERFHVKVHNGVQKEARAKIKL